MSAPKPSMSITMNVHFKPHGPTRPVSYKPGMSLKNLISLHPLLFKNGYTYTFKLAGTETIVPLETVLERQFLRSGVDCYVLEERAGGGGTGGSAGGARRRKSRSRSKPRSRSRRRARSSSHAGAKRRAASHCRRR